MKTSIYFIECNVRGEYSMGRKKVGIIGLGNVGSTVAHHIIIGGYVDDLVLIDENEEKSKADALDFEDAMANLPHRTNLLMNDYDELEDADMVISSVGKISLLDQPGNNRFLELDYNAEAVSEIAPKIKKSGFKGRILVISNPVDVITGLYQELTGLPKNHVIGTGTLLDTARMKRAVGEILEIDPRSVQGYSLGEHGNSQFVAWSNVTALGRPIEEIAQERDIDLEEITQNVRDGGFVVLNGKKYTNYGIAAATVRLMNTIFSDAHSELPVSNYNEKYGTYLSYPAIVGREGILEQVQLNLTDSELEKLQTSANYILKNAERTTKNINQ